MSQSPSEQEAARKLIQHLLSGNSLDRRRAADMVRRVSVRTPGILKAYADILIELAASLPREQWQAVGYVTLAAALNATSREQRLKLAGAVRQLAEHKRNALRANALEAFAILAVAQGELRQEAFSLLEQARVSGTAAIRSRARRMLEMLVPEKHVR